MLRAMGYMTEQATLTSKKQAVAAPFEDKLPYTPARIFSFLSGTSVGISCFVLRALVLLSLTKLLICYSALDRKTKIQNFLGRRLDLDTWLVPSARE